MSAAKFVGLADAFTEQLDGARLLWHCRPSVTAAKDLVVVEANWKPGYSHDFHRHPDQEEVIFVLRGTIEQWLGREKRLLKPGESAFVPPDMVHGSFNISKTEDAAFLAILGPSKGSGVELIDMSKEAPWNTLRK